MPEKLGNIKDMTQCTTLILIYCDYTGTCKLCDHVPFLQEYKLYPTSYATIFCPVDVFSLNHSDMQLSEVCVMDIYNILRPIQLQILLIKSRLLPISRAIKRKLLSSGTEAWRYSQCLFLLLS